MNYRHKPSLTDKRQIPYTAADIQQCLVSIKKADAMLPDRSVVKPL